MTQLPIPGPIADYFEADKRGDSKAVSRCFTSQATVKDEGRSYSGRAAIQQWKAAATAKYSYTSEPFAIDEANGRYVVTSRLTGSFPGSPIDLRYSFGLEHGKIASLEIAL
jgi:hypothetical protein